MLWVLWIWWCWLLRHKIIQHFILWIKHPVAYRWLQLSSLFCRQLQGTLLHTFRLVHGHKPSSQHTAITSAAAGGSSNCFPGKIFAQIEKSYRPVLGHGAWDQIISDAFPSAGLSLFFTGCFWVLRGNPWDHLTWDSFGERPSDCQEIMAGWWQHRGGNILLWWTQKDPFLKQSAKKNSNSISFC